MKSAFGVLRWRAFGLIPLFLGFVISVGAQEWVPYTGATGYGSHNVSARVDSFPNAAARVGAVTEVPFSHRPSFVPSGQQPQVDQALQTTTGSTLSGTSGLGFGGIGYNGYYPPDPNLLVGPTQIVQITNVQFAVYDKATGKLLKGPVAINSLFSSLGGLCASTNGGDPIVLWDKIAQRWLISQLAYTSNLRQDDVCIAISQTSDALGSFNVYGFGFKHLTDYPKFGVWTSSSGSGESDYYFSANLFSSSLYYGPVVCAFNGKDMQSDTTARYSCLQGSTSNFSLLPSDFDGTTPPGAGEANYFVELGTGGTATTGSTLIMYPFLAAWTTTGGSLSSSSAVTINVDPYSLPCSNGGTCIPQPGTSKQLDSLGDRLMYRLAYRNFEQLRVAGRESCRDEGNGVAGIRWYQINGYSTLANSLSVYQQGHV